jgi:hypothetical protein
MLLDEGLEKRKARQHGYRLYPCKSQHYPSENPIIILVGKLSPNSLPTRIIIVKATSLMLGFTLICEEVSYRSSSFSCANCGEDCKFGNSVGEIGRNLRVASLSKRE